MARKKPNVGLIGLGIIGTRVAAGLRASGFPVFVWNRTPKPTPNFLGSPAEVARACDLIQLFVSDAQAVFDVIAAMGEALTSEHVVICNATIGREATIQAARLVEAHGARFLDAPFTGSKMAAEKRQLVYYIGGDDSTFLPVRGVLESTSKAIVRIGKIGDAAVVKVVTNMINAVSIQALGEALAIVRKSGLEAETLAAALEQNACRSPTMELKLPKMIAGDYEPHFSLKHMSKDVEFGLEMARALELEVPTSKVTGELLQEAIEMGQGELDFAAVYQQFAEDLPAQTNPISATEDPEAEEFLGQSPMATALPTDGAVGIEHTVIDVEAVSSANPREGKARPANALERLKGLFR